MSCAVRSTGHAAPGRRRHRQRRRGPRDQPRAVRARFRLGAAHRADRGDAPARPRRRDRRRKPQCRARRRPRARLGAGAPRLPHARRACRRPSGDAEWQCLAQAIYFESRGEPLDGQVAVAEVVLNRVHDRRFPSTVCGVTTQGVGSGRGCQFSYACDGNSDVDEERRSAAAGREARDADAGRPAAHRHRRRDLLPHPLGPAELVASDDAHRRRSATTISTARRPRSRADRAQSAKFCTR